MNKNLISKSIKNKALEQLKSGKSLLGKDGAFAPVIGKYTKRGTRRVKWKPISLMKNEKRVIVVTVKCKNKYKLL